MNAPLALRPNTGIYALDFMDEAQLISAMESLLYPGAKEDSIKLVIANCRAQVLDPMTKPFHITPMQVKRKKQNGNGYDYVWRDVVMPGIELYRIKAARTNAYAGMDEALWGPKVTLPLGGEEKTRWDEPSRSKVSDGNWSKLDIEVPEWCEIIVYRIVTGTRYPFRSGRVYWEETYATAGRETSLPNEMWKKRKRGQLEKCAEALALRRAFPEIGAAPTVEEMEGKIIDDGNVVDGVVVNRAVEQPQPKIQESAAPATTDQSRPADAQPAGGGAAPDKTEKGDGEGLSDGARKTIERAMQRYQRTETDLVAAGFPKLDALPFSKMADVMKWLREHPAM